MNIMPLMFTWPDLSMNGVKANAPSGAARKPTRFWRSEYEPHACNRFRRHLLAHKVEVQVAYTIGVFSERRLGELKRSHLVFFWIGLICDSTGTGLMSIMAQNSGGTMSPLHPVTGFLAIALMLFHAAWATYVVFRGNEKTRRGFHTLSIGVWLVWLVPYFVGMLIGIPVFHVSDPIALAAAAGVVAVLALALLLSSKRSHA